MKIKRVTLMVLDGLGCGAAPDAQVYGDAGSHTLDHIAQAVPWLNLPNLAALGLGHVPGVHSIPRVAQPRGQVGRMQEQSPGKDTTTGHWELAGIRLDQPFPLYPQGFPPSVIQALQTAFGRPLLGNVAASGTEIIQRLGDQQVQTGFPIIYTSADSVLQLAAHEAVIPLAQLDSFCQKARQIMQGEHAVGRIIARPFVGSNGSYQRTGNRRDYSLPPPGKTILDHLKAAGYSVVGIGKINDIYAGQGLTRAIHTSGNQDGLDQTLSQLDQAFEGLIMTNLVDFDMLYGHRNDPEGFARALMHVDAALPALLGRIGPDELLILTADHGCDPTFPGTDHTREYVPLLTYSPSQRPGVVLGTRLGFYDCAASLAQAFGLAPMPHGRSFLQTEVTP